MRIKATQLIKVEDFPKEKEWIGKLISPINDFFNQAIKILNGGSLFIDNSLGKDHVYSFTYQSEAVTFATPPDGRPPSFTWGLLAKPLALSVVSALEDNVPFIAAVAWQYNNEGLVQLTKVVKLTTAPAVAKLTVGSRYNIRVRVTP